MSGKKVEAYVHAFLYVLGIVVLGYFLPRTSTTPLFLIYGGCFILYWRIYRLSSFTFDWKKGLVLALLLRLVLFASTPSWSEDYARFLWDGHMLRQGANPYAETPVEVMEQIGVDANPLMEELYARMNSPHYHSVYPPSNQFVFVLAASLGSGGILSGVLVIRSVLLLFELLTFYVFYLLLRVFRQSVHKLLLYALNPLVIMEITGNLHFEGMLLLLILAGIFFMHKKQWGAAGGYLAGAAAVKLSPLMLLPAFLKGIPGEAFWRFIALVVLILLLGLGPLTYAWSGFTESLNLYSNTFEFNASIYYLLRQVGYWFVGYNTIAVLGPVLKVLTLLLIVFISFRNKNHNMRSFLDTLLSVYWVYFLLNTVVHPWYIIPALGISVLTAKRSFIIWSLLIVLSYQTYQFQPYSESTWLLFLEYGLLALVLWKESHKPLGAG